LGKGHFHAYLHALQVHFKYEVNGWGNCRSICYKTLF